MTKETGIIMSGNHPKLILDGIKTMTRRVIIPQPNSDGGWKGCMAIHDHNILEFCPYGQVGDRLIIKEAWTADKLWDDKKPSEISHLASIWYPADGGLKPMWVGRIRSARFMCHWMSRVRPEITELRAERLQEITEADLVAEGIKDLTASTVIVPELLVPHNEGEMRRQFSQLWDSLNAKRGYGWDTNCWVWVIGFKVL